ncbi:uncharacterized protein LOC135195461 [Macrobrachium nipponense]|uniref:uncharacterized protein LOC135195461 n=1 Tax=Macrobrachium nipponense TaxID=159736 RepID=UPI0030C7F3D3
MYKSDVTPRNSVFFIPGLSYAYPRMRCLALTIFALLGTMCLGRDANDARIVAAYSTRTAITLTTITSVQPYTCFLYTNAVACQKRRLRRQKSLQQSIDEFADLNDKAILEGTVEEGSEAEGRALDSKDRQGRIALTVWTTSSSTYTITSTSINTAVTYSLSYYCSVSGLPVAPACG